jgi:hypothetical protein
VTAASGGVEASLKAAANEVFGFLSAAQEELTSATSRSKVRRMACCVCGQSAVVGEAEGFLVKESWSAQAGLPSKTRVLAYTYTVPATVAQHAVALREVKFTVLCMWCLSLWDIQLCMWCLPLQHTPIVPESLDKAHQLSLFLCACGLLAA